MLFLEYKSKRTNLVSLSKSFIGLSILTGLLLLAIIILIGVYLTPVAGIFLLLLLVYALLQIVLPKHKFWFDVGLCAISLIGGLCLIFVSQLHEFTSVLTSITIVFLGLFMLCIATYTKLV